MKPGQRPPTRRPPKSKPQSESGLAMTCSMSAKVNTGKYESVDAFVSLQGITPATTEAEIDAMLAHQGRIAWDRLRADLAAKVREIRRAGDAEAGYR